MEKEQKKRFRKLEHDPEMIHTPGGRVRRVRISADMAQEVFAESIGISEKHLGYIERGDRTLTRDVAHRISEKYSVLESWLLCETDYQTEAEENEARIKSEDERFINQITRNTRRHELIVELMQIHGYSIVEHEPEEYEIKTDEDGNKYYDMYYEIVSPSNAKRILSSEALNKFILNLDFMIEGQLLFITQRLEGSFIYG